MPQWREVEIPAEKMREAAGARKVTPVRVWVTEFDTNVAVERDAFVEYLLDPIPVLTGQPRDDEKDEGSVREELNGLVLEGVAPHWKIVTVLRNHHRGLNPRVNFASATVAEEEETVYQEIYKQLD